MCHEMYLAAFLEWDRWRVGAPMMNNTLADMPYIQFVMFDYLARHIGKETAHETIKSQHSEIVNIQRKMLQDQLNGK